MIDTIALDPKQAAQVEERAALIEQQRNDDAKQKADVCPKLKTAIEKAEQEAAAAEQKLRAAQQEAAKISTAFEQHKSIVLTFQQELREGDAQVAQLENPEDIRQGIWDMCWGQSFNRTVHAHPNKIIQYYTGMLAAKAAREDFALWRESKLAQLAQAEQAFLEYARANKIDRAHFPTLQTVTQ
jgi:hypothetical protein